MTLNIVITPTYDEYTMAITDASVYDTDPPVLSVHELEIQVPGFDTITTDFTVLSTNIIDSDTLSLGTGIPLPDGIYCITYTANAGSGEVSVEKRILRIDRLQKKFDEAFMTLDLLECDRAIKEQSFVTLNTIWIMMAAAVASASNCATIEATKMYIQASRMLDNFMRDYCACSGSNQLTITYE